MQSLLLLRKHNFLKFQREFYVKDFQTHETLFIIKENKLTLLQKIGRLLDIEGTSFSFKLYSFDNTILFSFNKAFTFFTSKTSFTDAISSNIGYLKRRLFRPDNVKYILQTNEGSLFYNIKFDSTSFNYKISDEDDTVLAKVISNSTELVETRERIAKSNTRHNTLYLIHFAETLIDDTFKQKLFLSVAVCIDLLYINRQE